ncbi:MAG TPA: MFS transporter [Mycobacteriales bacterium]|nr:MFS transporter [Mycobacteriales bacterium]
MREVENGRFRDALKVRDFRIMVQAFALDAIGSWAYTVVMLVYVYERTDSAGMVALASALRWLPAFVLGPYLGVLGDRYDRKAVMRVSAVLSGLVVLGMAAVVAADGPIALLLLMSVLTSTFTTPYLSASAAMRPDLVGEKDLAAANALFIGLESLTVVIGPLLGAALLAFDERSIAFVLNAISFFVAAWMIGWIQARSDGGAGTEVSVRKQMVEGFVTLWREKVALTLVLFVALDSAVYGATTVLYIPMSERFGTGPDGYGYLTACFALGGVLVTGVINRLSASTRLAPIVLGSMVVMAVPFALVPLTDSVYVGAGLQVLAGASMVAVDVLGFTALQRDLPREMLSRVMAIMTTLAIGGMLLGSLLPVPLLRSQGLSTTLVVFAVVLVLISVAGIRPLIVADARGAELLAVLSPRIALLEALDLLSAAPRATLEQLAKSVEVVELEAGVAFVRQGDEADALWVVVTGAVEVATVDGWGQERVHSGLGPHSYVGEIGLLRGIPRTATVRTTAQSTLWRIPADEVLTALNGAAASSSLMAVSSARLAQVQSWTARQPVRGPFLLPTQPTASPEAAHAPATEVPAPPSPRAEQPDPGTRFPVDPGAPAVVTLPDPADVMERGPAPGQR